MANVVMSVVGNLLLLFLILGLGKPLFLSYLTKPPSTSLPVTTQKNKAAQVDIPEFKQRFRKPVGICIGLVCQFVFLPLAGFASIRLFYKHDPVHGIPLLLTLCSPGGSYSNWWCSLFNCDLPLSMAMTSASSLFAVATLPINVLIYLKLSYPSKNNVVSLDWGGLFTSLAVVVVGICGGLFVGDKKPTYRPRLNALGNFSGITLVLAPIWARTNGFYLGIAAPCLFGLLMSLGFAKACGLPKPQCLSVTIETCYQNTAISLAVILSSFSNDDRVLCDSLGMTPRGEWRSRIANGEATADLLPPCDVIGIATGVPTFYQVAQVLSLGVLCLSGWKAGWTYAPAKHAFYKILTRNYQPGLEEPEPERLSHTDNGGEGLLVCRTSSGRVCGLCFPGRGTVVVDDAHEAARETDTRQTPSSANVDDVLRVSGVQLTEVVYVEHGK